MFADNYRSSPPERVRIPSMLIRVFIIICFLTLPLSKTFSSMYIFIEDSSVTGSLKSLLKEVISNDGTEVVGYTSKSLNVLLSKANQLQTSMVWLLRTGLEPESLVISRCGQSKVSNYTEDLVKKFMLMKSSLNRVDIGWIPYKELKHITKQCILIDIPSKTDLSFLSRDLSKLFNFKDTDNRKIAQSAKKILSTNSEIPSTVQSSRKIPLKWEQFADTTLREAQKELSETIKKLSYDPDEDFFLNPFVSGPTKSSTVTDPISIVENHTPNYSDLSSFRKFSKSTDEISTQEYLESDKTPLTNSTSSTAELTLKSNSTSLFERASTPSTYMSTITRLKTSTVSTNNRGVLGTYLTSNTQLYNRSVEDVVSTTATNQSTKQFNLLYDIRSDFREELLDKFRKDKVIKTPEWLFEE